MLSDFILEIFSESRLYVWEHEGIFYNVKANGDNEENRKEI